MSDLGPNRTLPTLSPLKARSTLAAILSFIALLAPLLGGGIGEVLTSIAASADLIQSQTERAVEAINALLGVAGLIWLWWERRAPNFRLSFSDDDSSGHLRERRAVTAPVRGSIGGDRPHLRVWLLRRVVQLFGRPRTALLLVLAFPALAGCAALGPVTGTDGSCDQLAAVAAELAVGREYVGPIRTQVLLDHGWPLACALAAGRG